MKQSRKVKAGDLKIAPVVNPKADILRSTADFSKEIPTLGLVKGSVEWVKPAPRNYPYWLFVHPNNLSRNPNQVIIYDNEGKFLKSKVYDALKSSLKEVDTSSYGSIGEAQIIPGKVFRIIFRSKNPKNLTQYQYDGKDAKDYMKVLDMAKESGIMQPVEFLSKAFMDKNRQEQLKDIKNSSDAWDAGYSLAKTSYDKAIEDARAEEQKELQADLAEKQKEEQESKGSTWEQIGHWAKVGAEIGLKASTGISL